MSDIFHKIDWLNIRVEKMLNDREDHIKAIGSFANQLSKKNKILEQETANYEKIMSFYKTTQNFYTKMLEHTN